MKRSCFDGLFKKTLFYIFLSLPQVIFSQSDFNYSYNQLIDSVKTYYGHSDVLVNGPLYFQEQRLANGSPFYENENFVEGSVYARGREFKNVWINYDINIQELLLLVTTSEGAKLSIVVSDAIIDSFTYSKSVFVVPAKMGLKSDFSYLQKVNKGKYTMFLGMRKDFVNRYSSRNPYGFYSKIKQTMFVEENGELLKISSKKSFLKLWPSRVKEISAFMRKNKIRLKKASADDLNTLMNFINLEIRNEN